MKSRITPLPAAMLALLMIVGRTALLAAADEAIPPESVALSAPAELQAIDTPNDNGASIILTWRKMPYDAPEILYDVLMAEDPSELVARLDKLVALETIDAERKAFLMGELGIAADGGKLFVPQISRIAVSPAEGAGLAPPCSTRADMPAFFGFKRSNRDYHALEIGRFENRRDLVLRTSTRWNDKLAKQLLSQGLVASVENVDDPNVVEVVVRNFSTALKRDKNYFFKLNVRRGSELLEGEEELMTAARDNWFAWHKLNLLVALFVLATIIMTFAKLAQRDPNKLFIRRIGGLEAVDEALGRAAEMGKPVFFCHGPGDLSSVVTISAINLLGKVAERVGEYGTDLKVTCLDYLVMQVSQEMVRDAFTRVGRSDAYSDDNVMFVTGDTFAYSAAVGGMMIREKAGTAFFFGRFGSESLLLSETGAITKAIQIAGTDSFTQIPFFITTCDYTLIGEEMYAGSAYLSREPRLVGSVKGQDAVKAIVIVAIFVGTILASSGFMWFARLFWPLT